MSPKIFTLLRKVLIVFCGLSFLITFLSIAFSDAEPIYYQYFFIAGSVFLLIFFISFIPQYIPFDKQQKRGEENYNSHFNSKKKEQDQN